MGNDHHVGPTPDETTLTLLNEARAGSREAERLLFERYHGPLTRWARGRLPGWARGMLETGDIVQETLVQSLRRIDSFEHRNKGAFQAYLRTGVLNRVRNEIRRASRQPPLDGTAGGVRDSAPSPLEQAIGRQLLERYDRALSALRPDDREAVIARVELGLSYAEVAAALGKPSPDAARMAVSRALFRFAQVLKSQGRGG